jgi:hypothetical protein
VDENRLSGVTAGQQQLPSVLSLRWPGSSAVGINDKGQITGYGTLDGKNSAFEMTPRGRQFDDADSSSEKSEDQDDQYSAAALLLRTSTERDTLSASFFSFAKPLSGGLRRGGSYPCIEPWFSVRV